MIIDNELLTALEIKSGETFNSEMLKGIRAWQKLTSAEKGHCALLYGGNEKRISPEADVITLKNMHPWFEKVSGKL
jgi:hypothetical protein